MKLPVVNHPVYVAKINDDNKFPIKKFGALADYLLNKKIVEKFHTPKACPFENRETWTKLSDNEAIVTEISRGIRLYPL